MQYAITTLLEKTFDNILVDTPSLLKPSFFNLMEEGFPVLHNQGTQLIIHQTVLDELTRFFLEYNTNRGREARRVLDSLHELTDKGCIIIDNTPAMSKDVFFLTEAIKARFSGKRLLILSQDSMLARDILLKVNSLQSFWGPIVNIKRIDDDMLADFDLSYSPPKEPINVSASTVLKKRFGL